MSHRCPHCDADLYGEPIPPEAIGNGWYRPTCPECGGPNHTRRELGMVVNDRVDEWICPDCGGRWAR